MAVTKIIACGVSTIMLAVFLAACADEDSVACAAPPPRPAPAAPRPAAPKNPPPQPRRQVPQQQAPKVPAAPKAKPVAPWGVGSYAPKANVPARKGYPQQYKPETRIDGYRHFPGYTGWYPIGVYPVGYVEYYGCTPPGDQEDDD